MNFYLRFFAFLQACIFLMSFAILNESVAQTQSASSVEASASQSGNPITENANPSETAINPADFSPARYLTIGATLLSAVFGAWIYFWRHRQMLPYELRLGLLTAIAAICISSFVIRNGILDDSAQQCMNKQLHSGSTFTQYDEDCRLARESFTDVLAGKSVLPKAEATRSDGTVAPLSVSTNAWIFYVSAILATLFLFFVFRFIAINILYKRT